ncbi:hypothetical protein E9232_003962 [Inquilinus ginsengisoli]|uniref:Uncharacterized protein n=1 Tax=Inquilinus ginsengisoli TaxID=363840 RepID=A0ABU1JT23_9PROT|nr:hypothetical protein [Inquilinus ginsengisoli]MDR6291428.1 hypothetical protein [Inquilinus ginsengisoli]
MNSLSELEQAVLRAIARQEPSIAEAIALQQDGMRILTRENTGAGFYATFEVLSGPPIIGAASPLGDVEAAVQGLAHGMGFLLWLKDGRLHQLEGYSYDESTSGLDFEHLNFGPIRPRPRQA